MHFDGRGGAADFQGGVGANVGGGVQNDARDVHRTEASSFDADTIRARLETGGGVITALAGVDYYDIIGSGVGDRHLVIQGGIHDCLTRPGLAYADCRPGDARGHALTMLKLHSRTILNISSSGWRKHEHNFPAPAGLERSQAPYQLRLLGRWFGFGPNEAGVGRQRVADNHMMRGSGREILDANVIFQLLAGGGAGGHAHADGDDRSRRIFSIDLGRVKRLISKDQFDLNQASIWNAKRNPK